MGILSKLRYSSGSIAASLTGQAFSTYVMFFYVDRLKLPPGFYAVGMALYAIWNAVNDPLFGEISDNTHSRRGRRLPYILFGMVPMALAFLLVWTPWFHATKANPWPLFAYFMVAIFLFDTLYTLVILNWTALFPEMYPSLEERAQVSAMRQVFGVISMILAIALPPMLYGSLGWPVMGGIFAVISLASLALCYGACRERPPAIEEKSIGVWNSIKLTLVNKSYVTYILMSMLVQLVTVILMAAIPFYTKYVLHVEGFKASLLLAMIFFVALPMLPVWTALTKRHGARTSMMLALVVFGVALIPFSLVRTYPQGILAAGGLGLGLAGIILLLDVLIGDVIDEDELKTGRRREGMYFGAQGFFVRFGIMLQSLISGFVLTRSGYGADKAIQPGSAIQGFRLLVGAIPLAIVALSLVALYFYPLHGRKLQEVRQAISRKGGATQAM